MTDGSTLLQAVCADPDDDGARLAYADWLEEHGARPRAEYIRLQIRLRTSGDDWLKVRKRLERLEKAHLDAWLAELPAAEGISWHRAFERGFPHAVCVKNLTTFRAHVETLFRAAPVREVAFSGLSGTKRLAAMPELARLTGLDLGDLRLGPADAEALAASPHLAGLRDLNLDRNRLGDRGAEALARSPYLKNLVKLTLGHNDIGSTGAKALARSASLASLEVLSLAGNEIDDAGALALAKSPYLKNLTGLTLWDVYGLSDRACEKLRERFGWVVSFMD